MALATCQALSLLEVLFDDIIVPRAVYDEVTVHDKPQAKMLAEYLASRIIEVDVAPIVLTAGDLGRGEIEAMVLYKTSSADYLLIDDQRARRIAEANEIHCIGALGTLLITKHQKHINQVAPYIQTLKVSSIYYTDELLAKALHLAGE